MVQPLFSEPYPIVRNISRLALVEPTVDAEQGVPCAAGAAAQHPEEILSEALWERLKARVQAIFTELAIRVESQWPTISSRAGATAARSYRFVFRTFYPPPGSDIDPVVVGVTIEAKRTALVIWGDIIGEESGEIVHETPRGEIAHEAPRGEIAHEAPSEWQRTSHAIDAVLSAATGIARDLAKQDEKIAGALGVGAKAGAA